MHALAVALLLMSTPNTNAPDLEAQTRAWHEKRIKNLTADEGWLTLVALDWMDEGENSAGSAPDSKLLFPKSAPPRIGTFTRHGLQVSFAPAPGVQVQKDGKPFAGG